MEFVAKAADGAAEPDGGEEASISSKKKHTEPTEDAGFSHGFSLEPRFGDDTRLAIDAKPLLNIAFVNGHATQKHSPAHRQATLSPRLRLPPVIFFYIRVKFQRVGFPFPPGISTKQYLHKCFVATTGAEHAEFSIPFDEKHVIGLHRHQLSTVCQLQPLIGVIG